MFSYFSKNFNAKEQEILNDKFLIHINDYTYDIPSEETYKSLLNACITHVFNNKYINESSNLNKYTINFVNNQKSEMVISVINREYIVELLENINNVKLNNTLSELSISKTN